MTNATNATVGETAKLFNIALTGDKYESTGVSKEVVIDENENWAVTYRQIRALKDFQTVDEKTVKTGTLGGWLAPRAILDQNGNCWVDETSYLEDKAIITGDALVKNSKVSFGVCAGTTHLENSRILGNCRLYNVKAVNTHLSNVVVSNTMARMTIISMHVKNVRVIDANNIFIASVSKYSDIDFNNIDLADGTFIVDAREFAYIQKGYNNLVIYPITDGMTRRFDIFTRNGDRISPTGTIADICTLIMKDMHLVGQGPAEETNLFN